MQDSNYRAPLWKRNYRAPSGREKNHKGSSKDQPGLAKRKTEQLSSSVWKNLRVLVKLF